MAKITLKKENVIKQVESEAQALALRLKGFQMLNANGQVMARDEGNQADAEKETLKKELEETREKLAEACAYAQRSDERIAALEQELNGTKEQLEAALKQNQKQAKQKKEDVG